MMDFSNKVSKQIASKVFGTACIDSQRLILLKLLQKKKYSNFFTILQQYSPDKALTKLCIA